MHLSVVQDVVGHRIVMMLPLAFTSILLQETTLDESQQTVLLCCQVYGSHLKFCDQDDKVQERERVPLKCIVHSQPVLMSAEAVSCWLRPAPQCVHSF